MSAFICSDRHIATIAVNYCKLARIDGAQAIRAKADARLVYPPHSPFKPRASWM